MFEPSHFSTFSRQIDRISPNFGSSVLFGNIKSVRNHAHSKKDNGNKTKCNVGQESPICGHFHRFSQFHRCQIHSNDLFRTLPSHSRISSRHETNANRQAGQSPLDNIVLKEGEKTQFLRFQSLDPVNFPVWRLKQKDTTNLVEESRGSSRLQIQIGKEVGVFSLSKDSIDSPRTPNSERAVSIAKSFQKSGIPI
jgi:hypothetical protein